MTHLKELILEPKKNLSNANGWQRIWIIFSLLMLVIHLLMIVLNTPKFSQLSADTSNERDSIRNIESWQNANGEKCFQVTYEAEFVKEAYQKKNKLRKIDFENQKNELRGQIEKAKERLFTIETSGGKYYDEWRKVRDQIDAYTQRYNKMSWSEGENQYLKHFSDENLQLLLECNDKEQKKKSAKSNITIKEANAQAMQYEMISTTVVTILSFFFFIFTAYGIGWSVAWVRSGFKK